ncbi:MAG: tetratricopeptide repeat protein, partial [Planctomycetota bacterium]
PPVQEAPAVPADASAEELLRLGRGFYEAGDHEKAELHLDAAATKNPELFDARFWRVRNRIVLGRVNDALDEADKLRKENHEGGAVDYLAGMAWHAKVLDYIRTGVDGGAISMSLEDAVTFLNRAVQSDADRFADAFQPLAEVAWYGQKLDMARGAADEAVRRSPKEKKALRLLGRVAFSQYQATPTEGNSSDGGMPFAELRELHWMTAKNSFEAALALQPQPTEVADRVFAGDVENQLVNLYAWKKNEEAIATHAANALGWNASVIDLSWLRGQFAETTTFADTLEAGGKKYIAHYGEKDTGDATLFWWLGWARFAEQRYPEAEAAFVTAVEEWPAYTNSHYYLALARYHQKDYDGSIASFRENWKVAPEDLVRSIGSNSGQNLAILDWLVGQANKTADLESAANLSEMQAETALTVPRYWNNMGLFYRDAGDKILRSGAKRNSKEAEQALGFYEKAWRGYSKAVELAPENPAYLNDAAVILDYNLNRDLERAKAMYEKAYKNAEAQLAA